MNPTYELITEGAVPEGEINLWRILSLQEESAHKGPKVYLDNGGGMTPALGMVTLRPIHIPAQGVAYVPCVEGEPCPPDAVAFINGKPEPKPEYTGLPYGPGNLLCFFRPVAIQGGEPTHKVMLFNVPISDTEFKEVLVPLFWDKRVRRWCLAEEAHWLIDKVKREHQPPAPKDERAEFVGILDSILNCIGADGVRDKDVLDEIYRRAEQARAAIEGEVTT